MTDYFALLDEPRRPWLETDPLKQKFLARCGSTHPDKIPSADHQEKAAAAQRFAELNAAYHCLVQPKSRLQHLLQLERGAKPADVRQIPPALAGRFADVAAACREADAFLAAKARMVSPLLQVQAFEQSQAQVERLRALLTGLAGLHAQRMEELKVLDAAWTRASRTGARDGLLEKLEDLYRWCGYFNRWQNQLQERIVQLSV